MFVTAVVENDIMWTCQILQDAVVEKHIKVR